MHAYRVLAHMTSQGGHELKLLRRVSVVNIIICREKRHTLFAARQMFYNAILVFTSRQLAMSSSCYTFLADADESPL